MMSFFRRGKQKQLDLEPVKYFDLKRYLGLWHEVARMDHRFERGLTDVMAEYTLKEDGTVKVENSGWNIRKKKRSNIIGHAKVTSIPGLLRVSFFWRFYSDYRILMLDTDYQWALVGAGNSSYLWILSRNKSLPKEICDNIFAEARRRGYDTSKLKFPVSNKA
ncbi:MAG: lipocalin family protein [Prevotella sp.]|jgi:lipocalin|nr:lipocalin family protein [Prevotella sp.]MCI1740918.1 lipocalin family protein [Prevotella sp.]